MRITSQYILALALSGSLVSQQSYADCGWDSCDRPQERVSLEATQSITIRRLSEAFGHLVGRDIRGQDLELNVEDVIRGLRAELAGQASPMTDSEYADVVKRFKDGSFQETASHNLALANAFMASNAKKPGVIELIPSKVQYRVLQPGHGLSVSVDSAPLVQYTGRYLDGTLFGSTEEAGGPIAIPLAQMIPGFRDGVAGMKEGEKRRLFIHPEFAYGPISEIPPNSLLVFEVEILQSDVTQPVVQVKHEPVAEPAKVISTSDVDAWDLTLDSEDNDVFSKRPLKLRPAN